MLMALPITAFAHGDSVIYIVLVPAIGTILMLIAMFFVKAQTTTKGVLVVTYLISAILVVALISSLPYIENERLITMLIVFVPVAAVVGMYFIIKAVKADS